MRLVLAAAVLTVANLACLHAQTVTLTLPEWNSAPMPRDSSIRLPKDWVVKAFDVKVNGSPANQPIDVYINDVRPRMERGMEGDSVVISVSIAEPKGFLASGKDRVKVMRSGRIAEQIAEWNISRWDQPYVEMAHATELGRPPEIEILEPRGGLFLVRADTKSVTVRAKAVPQGDYSVTIGGERVSPEYSREIPISSATKAVDIYVQNDKTGASKLLIFAVLRN